MRIAFPLAVLVVLSGLVAPAIAAEEISPVSQSMSDFDRNIALGAVLQMREGTSTELDELAILADRGLGKAQQAVAANPDSAEGQYALGSWLLYGYGVVQVDQINFDAEGEVQTETVTHVVQGLADDPEEGLDALKSASELAPRNGVYLLDYAAALVDYDRADRAEGMLKAIWAGQPELPVESKMRAGLLLSSIAEADGDLEGAREWIYSAISLDPLTAPAVEQLRALDAAELAAALAAPEAEEEGESELVEPAPEMPEESMDEAPAEEGQASGDQPAEEIEEGGEPSGDGETGGTGDGYSAEEQPEMGYSEEPGAVQEPSLPEEPAGY